VHVGLLPLLPVSEGNDSTLSELLQSCDILEYGRGPYARIDLSISRSQLISRFESTWISNSIIVIIIEHATAVLARKLPASS
jgi:hypothetical protein